MEHGGQKIKETAAAADCATASASGTRYGGNSTHDDKDAESHTSSDRDCSCDLN